MGDIYRRFAALAGPLMELDLPDPAGREVIQAVARRARRLDRMAELIPALRVGAEQGKFVELSEKLQGDTGELVAALDRGEVDKAVRALVDVWQSCGSCHKLFRDGEFAGR